MYQLSYSSIAAPNITEAQIMDILSTARNINESLNITGCLVFYNGSFIQIIEGDKENVKALFDKIQQDDRHSDVDLLWEGDGLSRGFSDWNMAYYTPSKGHTPSGDRKNFERNLLLLSELSERSSSTLGVFWGSVRKLMAK